MYSDEFILHMAEIDEMKLRISQQKSINFHSILVVSIVLFSGSVGNRKKIDLMDVRILMSGRVVVISSPVLQHFIKITFGCFNR